MTMKNVSGVELPSSKTSQSLLLSVICLVVLGFTSFTSAIEEDADSGVNVGDVAKSAQLVDADGEETSLLSEEPSLATVMIFMSTDCPIGNAFVPELNRLHGEYKEQGVRFLGVYSNAGLSLDDVKKHRDEFSVEFPVLFDEAQAAVDSVGATRTPDAVVLDHENVIRYRGRIDNRFGYTFKQKEPDRSDLGEALNDVLSGKSVAVPETETLGCLITRRRVAESTTEAPITFANQISRIMQKNCQDCHHPGTAAPFSLMTYEDVADHSEMIKEVVIDRRMPPWHADPAYGHFSNDMRLEQEEIDQLVSWVNAGTPMGDESEMPEPIEFADGWMIGEPDEILTMPESFDVPAEGVVEYKYWTQENPFDEDVWVQAAEARPDKRAVVHHIILYSIEKDEEGRRRRKAIVGTAPGEEPVILPEGMGIRIPAEATLLWEMHYTPTGRAATDQSQVGLVLCKEPPEREVYMDMAINTDFRIRSNDGNSLVTAKRRIPIDAEVITFMPHMHLRGKDFKYVAKYPDGTEETLLSVPQYDFNWQHTYRFAEPKFLPKGTVIECTAHFNNSETNPAITEEQRNQDVYWGDQTFEEMMIGFMKYVAVKE